MCSAGKKPKLNDLRRLHRHNSNRDAVTPDKKKERKKKREKGRKKEEKEWN